MRVVAATAALAALLLAGIGTAAAEDMSGQLITRSFTALPTPLVVTVEPDDNTRTNMTLAARLSRELTQRGYNVPANGAPLVLRFDSEIRSNVTTARRAIPARRERRPRPRTWPSAQRDRPDRPIGIANVLSSAQGRGVIGERSGRRLQPPSPLCRECTDRGPGERLADVAGSRQLRFGAFGRRSGSRGDGAPCWSPKSARRCATGASRSTDAWCPLPDLNRDGP